MRLDTSEPEMEFFPLTDFIRGRCRGDRLLRCPVVRSVGGSISQRIHRPRPEKGVGAWASEKTIERMISRRESSRDREKYYSQFADLLGEIFRRGGRDPHAIAMRRGSSKEMTLDQ